MAPPANFTDLQTVFGNVVRVAIAFAGIVLFIFLIIGGFKYITSGGDPKETGAAQRTVTFAVLGLILILSSYLILLLIGAITGITVTNFNIMGGP